MAMVPLQDFSPATGPNGRVPNGAIEVDPMKTSGCSDGKMDQFLSSSVLLIMVVFLLPCNQLLWPNLHGRAVQCPFYPHEIDLSHQIRHPFTYLPQKRYQNWLPPREKYMRSIDSILCTSPFRYFHLCSFFSFGLMQPELDPVKTPAGWTAITLNPRWPFATTIRGNPCCIDTWGRRHGR